MASIITRGTSYRVRWRAGRGGRQHCCTFGTRTKATAAKLLAEAHDHRIGSNDVYLAVDPDRLGPSRRRPTPLLRDWIEQWLRLNRSYKHPATTSPSPPAAQTNPPGSAALRRAVPHTYSPFLFRSE